MTSIQSEKQPNPTVAGTVGLADEELLRANLYLLLAGLLARAPSEKALQVAARVEGDDSDLGQALRALGKIASRANAATVAQEYHDLFIGLGRGELLPYASYYLTGFLQEKPLAKLRTDLADLGIARDSAVKEPEDHIAALMDVMAGLITGAFGVHYDLARQKQFFSAHIQSWAPHFFKDLEGANASVFYATLGTVGRIFMDIETAAFEMD